MKTSYCLCIVILLCTVTSAQTTDLPQAKVTHSAGEVPFKLYAGYLIVLEGRIGGIDKLRFALDTGMTRSMVDRKLARKVGLIHFGGKVLNVDKTVPAEWIQVPDIQFGPMRMVHFGMMAGDLRYFQSFATRIDAVIGLDLLRSSSFSIDYDTRKIYFDPVRTTAGVPMSSDPVCLTVQIKVGDELLRLIVDSGAQAIVLYEDRIQNRIPMLKIRSELEGSSLGGFVHSKRAILPSARLGTTDLETTVFLVKAPPGNVLVGIDGYLGTAVLKAHRVDFDFETNTLALTK